MHLTVSQAADYLGFSEKTIQRMIRRGEMPATLVHGRFLFNRTDLLEWAMARRIQVAPELLETDDHSEPAPNLAAALQQGGVFHDLEGSDCASALRAMTDVLRLPEDVDRALLWRMLLARESMASTGIGNGIAIPHVRNPVVLRVPAPRVTLCFLKNPVDFGAADGKPVQALFSLVTPTIRDHLALLARLAFVLRDKNMRSVIAARAPAERIMAAIETVEQAMMHGKGAP